MQVLFGILFHSLGGGASGSWYMPYNWVRKWRWEVFWIVGGLFSWLIMPLLAVLFTIPDWHGILHATHGKVILDTYVMGLLWGIGGLTYGLAIRYLGMSLGNSVLLRVIPSWVPKKLPATFLICLNCSWVVWMIAVSCISALKLR